MQSIQKERRHADVSASTQRLTDKGQIEETPEVRAVWKSFV
jgi:hypothetical protein